MRCKTAVCVLLAKACLTAGASAQTYTLMDVGVLRPDVAQATTVVAGISDNATVVGTSTPGTNTTSAHGFVWYPPQAFTPGMREIGAYLDPCIFNMATATSQYGAQVVGMREQVCDGNGLAWTLGLGSPAPLIGIGGLSGFADSMPLAVCVQGTAVGWSNTRCCGFGWQSGNPIYATQMKAAMPAIRLPDLGGLQSVATGISELSQTIVGFGMIPGNNDRGVTHPFVIGPIGENFGDGLHPMPGLGNGVGRAYDISNGEEFISGWSTDAQGRTRATLWNTDLSPTDLGVLPGTVASVGLGVNSSGTVVGQSGPAINWSTADVHPAAAGARAFVKSIDGPMQDLNDLVAPGSGWVLQNATGINTCGWISGNGTLNGVQRGFVLKPCAPVITSQPDAFTATVCPPAYGSFYVAACSAIGFVSYQWRYNGVEISNGDAYTGVNDQQLNVWDPMAVGEYDCVVTNDCGTTISRPGHLVRCFCSDQCPADFNVDGGVDGSDVGAFFSIWESGDCLADVNLDGGVDQGDVDVFFGAWEAGGC
jgi:uncharacterized membrane protein